MNIVSMLFSPLKFFLVSTKGQEGFYVNEETNHVKGLLLLRLLKVFLEIGHNSVRHIKIQ